MKITDITTTLLSHYHPKPIQDGTTISPTLTTVGRSPIFVHIKTDEGTEGLGINQGYPGIRQIIEDDLKELLINQDPFDIEKLWQDMFWRIRGYGRKGLAFCAISAIDIGLWDLKAKALNLPLYKLLGSFTDSVPIYGSGGWTNLSDKELVKEMTDYTDQGINAVKMKVGKNFGTSEREDIDRVEAVRKAIGDDVELYLDANGAYYSKQAIYMAKRFENFGTGWFEEPVIADDIEGLSQVKQSTQIPIASGEHEYTKYGFKDLITSNAVDIVQPDVGRVGGITEWIKISHLSQSFNLQIAPHAFQLVHLHLACTTPNLKSIEYMNTSLEGDKQWYVEYPEPKNGTWSPFPDRPGLGLELNLETIEKLSV